MLSRTSPLRSAGPLRRSSFVSKAPPRKEATQSTCTPRPRETARALFELPPAAPVPKDCPADHEGYRRLVAARRCIRCSTEGRSQAAHGPALGRSIKADDRTCVPLCADSPGALGCHSQMDQYIGVSRGERVRLFALWGAQTRADIQDDGAWPADLEPW